MTNQLYEDFPSSFFSQIGIFLGHKNTENTHSNTLTHAQTVSDHALRGSPNIPFDELALSRSLEFCRGFDHRIGCGRLRAV